MIHIGHFKVSTLGQEPGEDGRVITPHSSLILIGLRRIRLLSFLYFLPSRNSSFLLGCQFLFFFFRIDRFQVRKTLPAKFIPSPLFFYHANGNTSQADDKQP